MVAETTEDKTDKQVKNLKTLSLVNNIHSLTPQMQPQKAEDGVAIINALKSDSQIKEVYLQLKGYFFSPFEKTYIEFRKPVMNDLGIGNFLTVIGNIAKSIEFSSFREQDVGKLAVHLIRMNYPYFTIYAAEYDLDKKDFNLVYDLLFTFIVSSFNKAKGSGHRNVVRGTYSEDLLGRFGESGVGKEEKNKFHFPDIFKKNKAT